MKKMIYLLVISFLLVTCKTKNLSSGIDYEVLEIDSIESVYIIYAERTNVTIKNTNIIKIVSSKDSTKCNKNKFISVNKIYKLNLESLYPKNLVSHHLKGINYNGITIPFDKDYNVKKDLFVSSNLQGLCYVK